METTQPALGSRQLRQIVLITIGAVAVFVFLRFLPTGTNLNHMDFRVNAKNAIEYCDPLNPQFIPVVAVASPVTMTLASEPLAAGRPAQLTLTLSTASGKQIEPVDLLVAHTKLLHLLVVDPTLTDYQHVHPQPGKKRGEWTFAFTPRHGGAYRVFADFTPAATSRGLYASADLAVAEASGVGDKPAESPTAGGYRFELTPAGGAIRAGKTADLQFAVTRPDGSAVPLEPVMGAFAHLVAFDEARSGFAHLHPAETDLEKKPDEKRPVLTFKITIPRAGRYVIWSQVKLGDVEVFTPFWFEVAP
ncbi:MAG TPA: hypothetical protein VHO24_10560 [Opitutaceae bacterium]|nr:hypothetical protein [Opitutaceae bacterium]